MATLHADDTLDLPLYRLLQHQQARADSQRQQTLLRRAGDLSQRQLNMLGKLKPRRLRRGDLDQV